MIVHQVDEPTDQGQSCSRCGVQLEDEEGVVFGHWPPAAFVAVTPRRKRVVRRFDEAKLCGILVEHR
jgi:hypothetical protein